MRPEKLISGGQTGADRAGLDAARVLGIPTGGTAPKGWRTESGPDPELASFGLVEHLSSDYAKRTEENIRRADGTVVFGDPQSAGSRLTIDTCLAIGRPFLVNPTPAALSEWVCTQEIKILNVAGNRRSVNPGVYDLTYETLLAAFKA